MLNYLLEGDLKMLAAIQEKEQDQLLARSNVVGVGLGNKEKKGIDTGEACLKVFVERKIDKAFLGIEDLIPATIGKYKTDVVEVGTVFAQSNMTNVNRMRPTMGGCGIGPFNRNWRGTLGTTVIRTGVLVPNNYYILSNNHVLAGSNALPLGHPILQPAGGVDPADRVALLAGFVPIIFGGGFNNFVDAAIAEVVDYEFCSPEIYGIGYIDGVANVALGTMLQKSGSTSGYTRGQVLAINAIVNVFYPGIGTARFANQIITTNMSAPGDSGSIVLNMRNNAVGLLFAGSSTITIMNPITSVLNALGVQFL